MLIIVVCGFQFSHEEKLDCEFKNTFYSGVGWFYHCFVSSLDNPQNNLTIDGYSGGHEENKNDANVKGIWIHGTNTKYIPASLGSLFHLTVLRMEWTQLVEIKARDFHGMQYLEQINLNNNKLSSVPLDVFATLTKLRIISLSENQIEELPNGIFVNCLRLQQIYLSNNKIKYLGTEIFHELTNLNRVHLKNNICVNKVYNGKTKVIQLKEDMRMKCKNLNEVPAMITATQIPMNADVIEFKNQTIVK